MIKIVLCIKGQNNYNSLIIIYIYIYYSCLLFFHRNEGQQEAKPTCPLEPACEFSMKRPTQGVLYTTAWGPRDPTPRTRQAGPPTTLAPATRTNVRSGLQFPLHLRRGSIPTGTTGPAGPSAAAPHIPMVGNHRDIFLPPDPAGPGRRSGVYPPVFLGHREGHQRQQVLIYP